MQLRPNQKDGQLRIRGATFFAASDAATLQESNNPLRLNAALTAHLLACAFSSRLGRVTIGEACIGLSPSPDSLWLFLTVTYLRLCPVSFDRRLSLRDRSGSISEDATIIAQWS